MTGHLTVTEVRRLLRDHGVAPRKAAGQNFLIDANTLDRIVNDAGVTDQDTILEIGPGVGSLTRRLAERARRVVGVEIDRGLVRVLEETVGSLANVSIVHADALDVDLGAVAGGPARIVSNLPYNVATPVVMNALADDQVTDLFVTVQREVAQRWAATKSDSSYGAVSVKIAWAAIVEVVAAVPATVFYPEPNVRSLTARITRRPDAPASAFRLANHSAVEAGFAHRRKKLANSLKAMSGHSVKSITDAMVAAEIAPQARAQEVSAEQFWVLAEALNRAG